MSAPETSMTSPGMKGALIVLVSSLGLASACASSPTFPVVDSWHGQAAAAIVVDEDERALWTEAREKLAELEEKKLLVEDDSLVGYLKSLVESLLPGPLPEAAPALESYVVRDVRRNAASGPDGGIFVSTGYLAALENEAQLAGVLGHEVAHFLARDSIAAERFARINASTVDRMKLSREREEHADQLGLELMLGAGYEPREMIHALDLIRLEDHSSRGSVPQWESHPFVSERIRRVKRTLRETRPEGGRRETERYEEAIAEVLVIEADLELETRFLDRAEASIARYLRLRPESSRGHYLKAELVRLNSPKGRRSPAARRWYERAVELSPQYPDALRELGLLCREDGDSTRAIELLSQYLELAPDAVDRRIIERYIANDTKPTSDGR
jgi:tetratricopeptide (TPR) repeat protein